MISAHYDKYKILVTHLNIALKQPLSTSKIASPFAAALLCTHNVAEQSKKLHHQSLF